MPAASIPRSSFPLLLAWPGLAALAVAMGIGRFAFTPLWPLMAQDAGLSLAQGGWLASANYAGYLLGALAAVAFPIRRLRAGLLGSLAAAGLLTLAMGQLDGMAAWLALRLAAGYASACTFICVAAWRPVPAGDPREGPVMNWTYAGVGIGIAASGLACLALMRQGAGADASWRALGVLALAASALVAIALARSPGPASAPAAAPAAPDQPAPAAPGDRGARWLVPHYGLFGMGYIVPATFLPAMAKAQVPDPAVFGWVWPCFGAAAAVSCLLAPRLARGRDERRIWRAAQLLMAAGMAAPALLDSLGAIALAALLVGGTFVVITQAGMQAARRGAGANAARAAAAMTAAFALGQILGPLAAAWAARHGIGLPAVLAASAALLAAGALALPQRA
ncbi:YbfB/YjiJ family MFS transporter [Bordetella petrii]|uniref:YbfB/YjiJ family MFS transporter n=1 Tax=Bordetella petrii TaxID=94624 RepID=UPI001A9799C5|nr:YbfB/YjiJ family MFS transporter [Bordetella petrii]MBO1114699.1 YbfB/YjiJ family MFS transporter [Bordetella petrii]